MGLGNEVDMSSLVGPRHPEAMRLEHSRQLLEIVTRYAF